MEEKLSDIGEGKIKEVEIEPAIVSEDGVVQKMEMERHKKMDAYIEFGLILILGILIGIAVKTEANKRLVIGFDDYRMKLAKQDFNINKLQFEMAKKNAEEPAADQGSGGQQNQVEPAGEGAAETDL
ncbi:MAG: hypothetical protein U0944_02980 [Candidatus Moranbacteria bacterium]|nr:hypothetical protein [Candidatus Moranbacteria bacterium]MDZ4385359.1 hypothetical protein [Candidatus Moranbacteria bacterium]